MNYLVRYAFTVDAETPNDAVAGVVDLMVESGLINWAYRVDNPDTGEIIGFYDGRGDEIDMSEVMTDAHGEIDAAVEPDDGEYLPGGPAHPGEPVESAPADSEAALHKLAAQLNEN